MRRPALPIWRRALKAFALTLLAVATPGHAQDGGPGGPNLTEHQVTVDGAQRSYYVYLPPKPADPAPVVMMFHGGGGRPQGFARRAGMNEVADQYGFAVVYPEGMPQPSGRGFTWDVGGPQSTVSANEVAFVQAILRDLGANMSIDPARIYATGVSMGGVLSYRLACEMSGTFAAIAPVSATMVDASCHPSSPVAILHIHGTADDRIPLDGGHGKLTASSRTWPAPKLGIAAWSKLDSCAAQPTRDTASGADCQTYTQCRAPVEFCVRPGMRHGWPDDVAPEIWAFFAAHPKAAP